LNAGPGSWLSLPVRLGSKLPPTPPAGRPPRKNERVVIWVRNPTNVCPLAFPLDLWVYRQANPLASTSLVRLGSNLTPPAFLPGLQMQVEISSMLWDPANGDFRFHIDFTYTAPGNVNMPNDPWVLALRNGSTHALEVHSWITAGWRGGAVFGGTAQADDDAFLVGAPADSPGIVSVASVNSRLTWRPHGAAADVTWGGSLNEISSFSSPGPLRAASVNPAVMYGVTDDIRAVDVTAPGNRLQAAATSHPANPHDPTDVVTRDAASLPRSMMLQGTSMASPVVTGMVANLLALKPNLTVPEVIDRLKRCSAIPASSAFQPAGATPAGSKPWSRDWGYGLVDGRTLDLT
jgi:subtilisin family serine protease